MSALLLAGLLALSAPDPSARRIAPDVELKDLAGKRVRLSALQGKVVILSFWATWCGPCLQELPQLQKIAEASGGEVVVLAINTDGPDSIASVRSVAKRHRLGMTVLLDVEGKATSLFNPRGTNPYTVLLDRRGRVADTHEGYASGDEVALAARVKALSDEHQPQP